MMDVTANDESFVPQALDIGVQFRLYCFIIYPHRTDP